MKEAISRFKDTHKAMCTNNADENESMYKGMKIKAMDMASKPIEEKVEDGFTELNKHQNGAIGLARWLKIDNTDAEGGGYMTGYVGKLCFNEN